MSEITYFTKDALKQLKAELQKMKAIDRPAASKAIAEAREKGDLRENAEYDAAKEAQGLLELKISKLKDSIANARIVDETQMDNSKVFILSTVTIKNSKTGAKMKYTLVPENEADLKTGKISISSPIAQGLLGKKVGDVADVVVPNGKMKFEVIEISR